MLGFLKRLLGLPTKEEVAAAKEQPAPYKVEAPIVNTKTGELVDIPLVEVAAPATVNDQITDSVTQVAPAKKPRKPRTPKAEKPAKEKAAKVKKPAAKRSAKKSKSA